MSEAVYVVVGRCAVPKKQGPGDTHSFFTKGQKFNEDQVRPKVLRTMVEKGMVALEGTASSLPEDTSENVTLTIEVEDKPKTVLASKQAEDPARLEKLDLDDLNVMVLGKDSNMAPFDTKAQAIAWLSKGFGTAIPRV